LPSTAELDEFYDTGKYDEYLSGITKSCNGKIGFWDKVITKIAWKLDNSDQSADVFLLKDIAGSENVCDIGCGSGDLLERLRPHVGSVVGIDPSPVSINALESKGITGFLGTGEALPEELLKKKFDLITMQQSLEHCLNPVQVLTNIRDLCSPGGKFLIEVPNHENYGFSKYGPAWFHTDAGRHIQFFSRKSLSNLLSATGWDVTHVGFFSYTRQFGPQWVNSMQEVWDCLYSEIGSGDVRRARQSDRIIDLMRSVLLERSQKYDVLRVVCSPTQRPV
jgi:2-polyprenyl-3-methyl-5-hydroxy-6-metoxy-1,4-benzoquinol methylase